MTVDLKNVDSGLFDTSITEARFGVPAVPHPPRILMLYGSVCSGLGNWYLNTKIGIFPGDRNNILQSGRLST